MDRGPTTTDGNENRPSNPLNTLVIATIVVFVIMLLTGHVPSF